MKSEMSLKAAINNEVEQVKAHLEQIEGSDNPFTMEAHARQIRCHADNIKDWAYEMRHFAAQKKIDGKGEIQ